MTHQSATNPECAPVNAVQRVIPLNDRDEWEAALRNIPHSFHHTWTWCRATAQTTRLKTFLYVFTHNSGQAACVISERRFRDHVDVVTPPGFTGLTGNVLDQTFPALWKDFARERNWVCGYVGVHPILGGTGVGDENEAHTYNEVFALDLSLGPDELYKRLSLSRRREFRDWEHLQRSFVLDRERLVEFYITHHREFLQTRGATSGILFSETSLEQLLGDTRILMVGAGDSGGLQAVTVFAQTPFLVDFMFNVSTPGGRRFSAPLIWYGVNHFLELGAKTLNLGGGIRIGDGVAEFKRRFRPNVYPLRALRQVYDHNLFRWLCRAAAASPDPPHHFFPPYRTA